MLDGFSGFEEHTLKYCANFQRIFADISQIHYLNIDDISLAKRKGDA